MARSRNKPHLRRPAAKRRQHLRQRQPRAKSPSRSQQPGRWTGCRTRSERRPNSLVVSTPQASELPFVPIHGAPNTLISRRGPVRAAWLPPQARASLRRAGTPRKSQEMSAPRVKSHKLPFAEVYTLCGQWQSNWQPAERDRPHRPLTTMNLRATRDVLPTCHSVVHTRVNSLHNRSACRR